MLHHSKLEIPIFNEVGRKQHPTTNHQETEAHLFAVGWEHTPYVKRQVGDKIVQMLKMVACVGPNIEQK